MKLQLKKILSAILIAQIIFLNIIPTVVAEEGIATAVIETTITNTPSPTPQETTPTESTTPQNTPAPTTEATPTQAEQSTELTPTPTIITTEATPTPTTNTTTVTNPINNQTVTNNDEESEEEERAKLEERRARSREAAEAYLSTLPTEEGDTNRTESATSALQAGVNLESTVGDSTIQTGDNTVSSAIVNSANNNLAGNGAIIDESSGTAGGAQVVTSGNGSFSDNSGALILNNDSMTVQDNTANVDTSLNQGATTGNNNNSKNVGGNSTIETGDANSSGTVITAVNTNASGVIVSEFNITDDQVGDIILDFGAGCIIGCGSGSTNVENTGNGSFSDNEASVNETNNDQTFQNNDANIGNELILTANSGNNSTNDNTGGNSNITTGDANVSANALTLANNNIAGNVIYAVVNIFGDLIGDILLPEDAINNCCEASGLSAANIGNGSLSDNDANITNDNNTIVDQNNFAEINNNLILDAQTGDNSTSNNTGGDSTITSGNTDVTASLLNVVNNNLAGNMWLVLINEAGNWVGKLLGAPEGSNIASSQGTELRVDNDGQIYATNSGNGTGSDNNADVSKTNNNTASQTNNAQINNTLDLSVNTGGNTASNNTGGNSNITTGDATIVANLVNFVNNNIMGNGKLVVSVVNVFGNWFGDFVTPGQKKQNKPTALSQNTDTTTNTANNAPTTTPENNTTNTPTPTPSKEQNTGFVAGVSKSIQNKAAAIFNNQTGNEGSSEITGTPNKNGSTAKVAGISATNNKLLADSSLENSSVANTLKTKGIKINLAWLVLLAPILGALIAKKYLIRFIKK